MEGDQAIGADLAASAGLPADRGDWILEGGALDTDGTGLVVTTEQCLLNPTRNPALSRAGQGTGLGLSLSHDIVVKQHGGQIEVERVVNHLKRQGKPQYLDSITREEDEAGAEEGDDGAVFDDAE